MKGDVQRSTGKKTFTGDGVNMDFFCLSTLQARVGPAGGFLARSWAPAPGHVPLLGDVFWTGGGDAELSGAIVRALVPSVAGPGSPAGPGLVFRREGTPELVAVQSLSPARAVLVMF